MYSTNRDVTCVGDHEVYCRVYAYQAGYGASLNEAGWVWVDTRVVEKGIVTITQKPLVITANSFFLSAEEAPNPGPLDRWFGVSVRGLVEGDTVNTNGTYLTWSCPTYQYAIGQYRIDPVYRDGVTAYDVAGGNYTVYLRPGVVSVIKSSMIIGGVLQFGELDPEAPNPQTGVDRVEITYNGESTNLVIDVQEPTGDKANNLVFKYSTDDGRTWTSELPTRLHVGTTKVWYVVEDGTDPVKSLYFAVTNYNYLIVNPRPVTLTAASATKRYDGLPLSTNDYAITAGSLATGDELTYVEIQGTRTDVGTTSNVVSNVRIANDSAGVANADRTFDYAITYVDGALTVTPGGIRIGDVTYVPGGQTAYGYQYSGVYDVDKIYDGIGTNIDVRVVVPEHGYRISYTTNRLNEASVVWTNEYSFTEAGTYAVNFLVQAANYADVTNVAYVVIRPCPLTVTVLDTCMRKGDHDPEFQSIVTYSATGELVPQEVLDQLHFTIAPTNAAYQTEFGEYDLVIQGDTVQGNYSLTCVPGTLTVDNKLGILYALDGLITGYDGNGHAISATVTNGVPSPVVHYALSAEGPWQVSPPVLTNATPGTLIYYAIDSTVDYRAVTNVAVMVITQRVVTATSADGTWVYDRQEHVNHALASVTGFVAGETYATNWMGAITDVGTVPNVFAFDLTAGTAQAGNYTFVTEYGTLTVTTAAPELPEEPSGDYGPFHEPPAAVPPASAPGAIVSSNDWIGVYDGAGHTIRLDRLAASIAAHPLLAGNDPAVSFSLDGSSWQAAPFYFTNVVTTSFWYCVTANNCSNYYHAASVTITQRVVEVTSGSEEWFYDGAGHQNTNVWVSAGSFAPGEGIETNDFATITEVGTKANAFGITWPEGTRASNYALSVVTGLLTVVIRDTNLEVIVDPEEFLWSAAGTSHFPAIVVRNAGNTLTKDVDYTFTEEPQSAVGKYTVSVTGLGTYAGCSGATNFWVTAHEVETWVGDVCQGTNTVGAAISGNNVFVETPAKEGYCVDVQHSVTNGIVRRVDDPQGLLRLVVRYEKDANGDNVPDKFQRKITFRVMNGYWDSPRGYVPQVVWVTKYAPDGVTWDVNGTGTLGSLPTAGNTPYGNAFTTGGTWWPSTPTKGMSVGNGTSPVFVFAYDRPHGGANRTVNGSAVAHDFTSLATFATFAYVDGRATYAVGERTGTGRVVVVATPLEATEVVVKGTAALAGDATAWQNVTTKALKTTGFVTVDVGSYRYFKIESR